MKSWFNTLNYIHNWKAVLFSSLSQFLLKVNEISKLELSTKRQKGTYEITVFRFLLKAKQVFITFDWSNKTLFNTS